MQIKTNLVSLVPGANILFNQPMSFGQDKPIMQKQFVLYKRLIDGV